MKSLSFEKAINELEKIVQELETGDLPLEKAFKRFEEGIKLSKLLSQKLEETEKKITILLQGAKGNRIEKSFGSDDPERAESPDDHGPEHV